MQATQQLVGKIVTSIIAPTILVIFSLGILVFVWGLAQFLKGLNDGKTSQEGKLHMIWGVAGMFIMVSVFGIITLISNTLGLNINVKSGSFTPDTSRLNNIVVPGFGQ